MSAHSTNSRWRPLFERFVGDLRIQSKEIASLDPRGVPLVLWESQKRFLDNVAAGLDNDIRVFYCLKSRQLGVTTVSLAVDLFWLAMHPNLTCALVTENEQNRDKNRLILRNYMNSFPEGYFGTEFQIAKGGDNRSVMRFTNGSRIDFKIAGTKDKGTSWGEGEGYAFAHLTEVASYGSAAGLESFEEAFAQTNPARLYLYESTAKGFNHWRSKYLSGKDDPFVKKSFFIGWWASGVNRISRADPRFQEFGRFNPTPEEREKIKAVKALYGWDITPEQLAWIRYREVNREPGDDIFEQNQPWTEEDAFIMTGYSFFQTRLIGQHYKEIVDNPDRYGFLAYAYNLGNDFFHVKLERIVEEDEYDRIELRVWEEPVAGAKYVIGADPAYGRTDNKDRHSAEVFRCYADRLVQVAEFATANIEAKHFAWVLAHLAGAYEDCVVNVEIGGPGRIIMLEWDHIRGMMNAEMNANLIRERDWENAMGMARWYLYRRPDSLGAGYCLNFETTWKTKQEIMHGMKGSFSTGELVIRSRPLLDEMRVVVQDGSEISAPDTGDENCKDDRVFATALAIRAWTNWVRPSMIADGKTFERVNQEERGLATSRALSLDGIVFRFFKTKREQEEEADPRPKWMVDKGLA